MLKSGRDSVRRCVGVGGRRRRRDVVGEDVGEVLHGFALGGGVEGQECWSSGGRAEGGNHVVGGGDEDVVGGGDGHSDLCGHPGEGVDDAFGAGVGGPDAIAAIVAGSWAEVPAVDGVWRPGAAYGGFLVDEHACAWWSEGSAVVIEGAVHLGVGGEERIDAGGAEEVEADECLWETSVPEVEGEGFVGAAETGDEMVFEGSDGSLSGVAAVDVWRGELEVDVLAVHVLLEGCGGFVV